MTEDKRFGENLILYKARNDGSGSASQWSISSKKDCVFLEMANQNGKDDNNNARFDWGNKIVFKLGVSDIGEILATLVGMQNGVGPLDVSKDRHKGLFHSNAKGNAVLYLGKDENKILKIHLSVKAGNKQTVVRHAISKGESCVLATLLRQAIETIYRWG